MPLLQTRNSAGKRQGNAPSRMRKITVVFIELLWFLSR
jgi:hypothetical protein